MKALAGLALLVVTVAGCGLARDAHIAYTRGNLNSLEVGMSREQVVAVMGQPRGKEAVGATEYLLYRTESPDVDVYGMVGVRGDRDLTPVVLVNGRVVGWGRSYYDHTIRAKIENDVTVRQR